MDVNFLLNGVIAKDL